MNLKETSKWRIEKKKKIEENSFHTGWKISGFYLQEQLSVSGSH